MFVPLASAGGVHTSVAASSSALVTARLNVTAVPPNVNVPASGSVTTVTLASASSVSTSSKGKSPAAKV